MKTLKLNSIWYIWVYFLNGIKRNWGAFPKGRWNMAYQIIFTVAKWILITLVHIYLLRYDNINLNWSCYPKPFCPEKKSELEDINSGPDRRTSLCWGQEIRLSLHEDYKLNFQVISMHILYNLSDVCNVLI